MAASFKEIYDAIGNDRESSMTEKKALRRLCVKEASGGTSNAPKGGGDSINRLPHALAAVHARAGRKLDIPKAKQWLRTQGHGGQKLAGRLSRLSVARNSDAHPDLELADDIAKLELKPSPWGTWAQASGGDASSSGETMGGSRHSL